MTKTQHQPPTKHPNKPIWTHQPQNCKALQYPSVRHKNETEKYLYTVYSGNQMKIKLLQYLPSCPAEMLDHVEECITSGTNM